MRMGGEGGGGEKNGGEGKGRGRGREGGEGEKGGGEGRGWMGHSTPWVCVQTSIASMIPGTTLLYDQKTNKQTNNNKSSPYIGRTAKKGNYY